MPRSSPISSQMASLSVTSSPRGTRHTTSYSVAPLISHMRMEYVLSFLSTNQRSQISRSLGPDEESSVDRRGSGVNEKRPDDNLGRPMQPLTDTIKTGMHLDPFVYKDLRGSQSSQAIITTACANLHCISPASFAIVPLPDLGPLLPTQQEYHVFDSPLSRAYRRQGDGYAQTYGSRWRFHMDTRRREEARQEN